MYDSDYWITICYDTPENRKKNIIYNIWNKILLKELH